MGIIIIAEYIHIEYIYNLDKSICVTDDSDFSTIIWYGSYHMDTYHMDHIICTYNIFNIYLVAQNQFWNFREVNCIGSCISRRFVFAIDMEYSRFNRCSGCNSWSCSCWRCSWSRLWRRTDSCPDSSVWSVTRWSSQPWSWCRFYQNFEGISCSKAT